MYKRQIYGGETNIIKLEHLSHRDCAVGLLSVNNEKILLASIYLDIKEPVINEWMTNLITFANRKKYPIVIGMDSNAHSSLFGTETNARGEDLESFLINNSFLLKI